MTDPVDSYRDEDPERAARTDAYADLLTRLVNLPWDPSLLARLVRLCDSLRMAAAASSDIYALASAVAHILDHLKAQQTGASIRRGLDQAAAGETEALGSFAHYAEPDPLDETNHADRVDCDGEPWRWCDECDGFHMGTRHKHGLGLSVVTIDGLYGPLTFAPRPADTPTAAPQPEQANGDADEPARPELNVQTALADAWDEGHRTGRQDERNACHYGDQPTPNPYRKARA